VDVTFKAWPVGDCSLFSCIERKKACIHSRGWLNSLTGLTHQEERRGKKGSPKGQKLIQAAKTVG